MGLSDALFIAFVPTTFAFFLSWLIMSDSKAEDIKKLFRFITPKKLKMGYWLIYDEESGKSLYVEALTLMDAIERSCYIDYDKHKESDHIPMEGK